MAPRTRKKDWTDVVIAMDRALRSYSDFVQPVLVAHGAEFRGEALAAISSVADLRITSRPPGQDVAFTLSAAAGQPGKAKPSAGGHGTRAEADNLFRSHPARLKFLKTPATERSWIRRIVDAAALANPGIAFRLDMTGLPVRYPARESAVQRMKDVLGSPLADDGVAINFTDDGMEAKGLALLRVRLPRGLSARSLPGGHVRPGARRARRRGPARDFSALVDWGLPQ